jgi:hypothetical protein
MKTFQIFALVFCYCAVVRAGSLTGPSHLQPGISKNFTWTPSNGEVFSNWVTDPFLTFSNTGLNSQGNFTVDVLLSLSITNACQIDIKVNYISNQTTQTNKLTVDVDPWLEEFPHGIAALTQYTIHPGQYLEIMLWDLCPKRAACQNYYLINDPPSCTGCGLVAFNNSAVITCNLPFSNIVKNAGKYTLDCSKACPQITFPQITITIMLDPPSIMGQGAVACAGIGETLNYSCTTVPGANFYDWSFPNGWQITSGNGSTNITVTTDGQTVGQVTVRAYEASTASLIKSLAVQKSVVCCLSTTTITQPIGPPTIHRVETGKSIDASNIISSGAGAVYHAGQEVILSNGFDAQSGSQFQAYIESCTGVFAFRTKTTQLDSSTGLPVKYAEGIRTDIDLARTPVNAAANEIEVYPNPTSDFFIVKSVGQFISSIEVTDLLGRQLSTVEGIGLTYTIDISTTMKGSYLVNVTFLDGSRKMVRIVHN